MKQTQTRAILKRLAIGLIIILGLSAWVPLPYFVEVPGTAENLKHFVTVDGKQDNHDGAFMMTTVAVRRVTWPRLVQSFFEPSSTLVSREELMGDNNSEAYDRIQQYYMTSSQNTAIKVALDLADKPYRIDYRGVYVLSIDDESNFKEDLAIGDTIYAIDGKPFQTSEEFINYVQSKHVGDKVTVSFERDGRRQDAKEMLIKMRETGKPGIGIGLTDHTEIAMDAEVQFDTEDIGGPSAGLMFTLELYSLLTGQDLRNGQTIAGTGTIAADGSVGRIGGADKKVIAADRAGATVFFAPDDTKDPETNLTNYQEAQQSARDNQLAITVVPVNTVTEALDYLSQLKTAEQKKTEIPLAYPSLFCPAAALSTVR